MQFDPIKYPDKLDRTPLIRDLPNGLRQKVRDVDGHWIWQGRLSSDARTPIGYLRGGVTVSVRRCVASLCFGKLDNDMRVRSKCGDVRCVAPQCLDVAFASHWLDTGCGWERREFCGRCGTKIGRDSRGWRRCHHCAHERLMKHQQKRRSDPEYRARDNARHKEYKKNLPPAVKAKRNAANRERMRELRRRKKEMSNA